MKVENANGCSSLCYTHPKARLAGVYPISDGDDGRSPRRARRRVAPALSSGARRCSARPECPLGVVAARPSLRRIGLLRLVAPVGRRGDRQRGADRLDPVHVAVRVEVRHHYFSWRSSSAWAKNADAVRRISFARFSSRFSRSSSVMRCLLAGGQARALPVASRSAARCWICVIATTSIQGVVSDAPPQ